jgi:hypothetical protein
MRQPGQLAGERSGSRPISSFRWHGYLEASRVSTLGQPVTRTDCPLGVRSVTRAGAQIDEVEGPERRLGVQLGLDDSRESDGGDRILAVVSTWAFCRAVRILL